ncbi:hypothetical protein HanIR_Chr02g0092481 [Helianthus annuus]|nr:hypothetical protein HanIR_Chr02g0092481 [Helianthus annuus]
MEASLAIVSNSGDDQPPAVNVGGAEVGDDVGSIGGGSMEVGDRSSDRNRWPKQDTGGRNRKTKPPPPPPSTRHHRHLQPTTKPPPNHHNTS